MRLPPSLRGLDFRFDPRTRAFETTCHTAGGFGLVFDEWGRSFSPYSIDHLQPLDPQSLRDLVELIQGGFTVVEPVHR